jgi:quercetin dioxygenase-like cupin family protein
MMALIIPLPSHSVPTHSHKHEQNDMVHDGKVKLCVGEQEQDV